VVLRIIDSNLPTGSKKSDDSMLMRLVSLPRLCVTSSPIGGARGDCCFAAPVGRCGDRVRASHAMVCVSVCGVYSVH
jgi:hypothetical protein